MALKILTLAVLGFDGTGGHTGRNPHKPSGVPVFDGYDNPHVCHVSADDVATLETANGLAKRVHGDVVNLETRNSLKFIQDVPYETKMSIGSEFVELVWLTDENGFTFGGTGGTSRDLNDPVVAISDLAKITPSVIDFQTHVIIDLMSRARAAGEKAFEAYISAMMRNVKVAFDKLLEQVNLYGGSSMATLTSATDAGTSSVMTITAPTWAPRFWLRQKGMRIDAYNGSTLLNTRADLKLESVNMRSKAITVSGNADDINDIVAVGVSGSGVTLYRKGQKGMDQAGLKSIASLTSSSGTYLNISCSEYSDVWNGTQITWDVATEAFSWDKLQAGLEEAAGRGLDGDVRVMVPNNVWGQLNSSIDALRFYDSSYNVQKAEQGHEITAISYHAITGRATIVPSGYVMFGDVMAYPDGGERAEGMVSPKRLGSTNVTMNTPGKGDEMFVRIPGTNRVEYGAFSDQALYLPAPRGTVIWTA